MGAVRRNVGGVGVVRRVGEGARKGGAGTHKGSVGASQERSQGEPKKVRRARRRLQGHRRAHDYTGELVVE